MESIRYIICLIICSLWVPSYSLADTTGNLIQNGTFESGNSNGWTTSGEVMVLNDCCGSSYDLEVGSYGSIEQSFNLTSDTITQPMLDNGITINSSVLVQSGEGGNGGWCNSCGSADSFVIRLQIKDSNNNVLATTTQERFDVTSINGEVFSDSVSYGESGSNSGSIFVSGTDGAGVVGGLGGPNFDNISVTMTYDPVLLSLTQTQEIETSVEYVQEIEEEIKIIKIEPIEEITFEEYKEPEVEIVFEKFFVEELAKEEINTGTVSVFEEVAYEEPKTIEAFTAEVESFEEGIETTEVANFGGGFEGGPVQEGETITETSELGGEVEYKSGEETVAQAEPREEKIGEGNGGTPTESEGAVDEKSGGTVPQEEPSQQSEGNTEQTETETVAANEEVNETDRETETRDSESTSEGTEVADSTEEINQGGNQEVAASGDSQNTTINNQSFSIEDIEKQVNKTVKSVEQRMSITSLLVAKAMENNSVLDSYSNINQDIFNNQLVIDGGEYYETRKYIDNRNIYAKNQDVYLDSVAKYQKNLQETVDEVIRAEEHLRRIRGY